MMKLKSRFYAGMAENGITGAAADQLFDALAAFANFGFPESHAVSFAHLVYCSAWIKVHYPAAFLVSLLNAQPHGLLVPPEPGRRRAASRRAWSTPRREQLGRRAPRSRATPERPRRAPRPRGPAHDRRRAGDARRRGRAVARQRRTSCAAPASQQHHLEALAAAGALDSLRSRTAARSPGRPARPRSRTLDRLPGVVTGLDAPALPGDERDRAGGRRPVVDGPHDPRRRRSRSCATHLNERGVTRAERARRRRGVRGSLVAGVVTHRQHPETANGAVFINLEDETGPRQRDLLQGRVGALVNDVADLAPALVIRGSLERGQGTITLAAEFVEPLRLGATHPHATGDETYAVARMIS